LFDLLFNPLFNPLFNLLFNRGSPEPPRGWPVAILTVLHFLIRTGGLPLVKTTEGLRSLSR
jgi:hypothetical protein